MKGRGMRPGSLIFLERGFPVPLRPRFPGMLKTHTPDRLIHSHTCTDRDSERCEGMNTDRE